MQKYTWDKENQLDRDGKKALFRYLTLINLNQLFIMTFNIIIDRLIHGYKENSKAIVHNINGLIKELING